MDRRWTTIDDLTALVTPSEPRLSPDGTRVAFLVKAIDTTKNRYRTQLVVGPVDGGAAPRAFTRGESVSGHRFSPDGKSIAFVRAEEKLSQLWLLPLDGGEARKLTDLPAGAIGEMAFSPDGAQLLFSFRAADEAFTEKAAEERKKTGASTPPRVIERLRWRLEGTGFLPEDVFHLHLHDLSTGTTQRLTSGTRDYGSFCWSPGGERIAYAQNVAADPDVQPNAQALCIRTPGEPEPRRLGMVGPKSNLAWSPDGKWIAFLGHDDPDEFWGVRNAHVWIVSVETGEARDLLLGRDIAAGDVTLAEASGRGDVGPVWEDDSQAVRVVLSERGGVGIWRLPLGEGEPQRLTPDGCAEVGFSLAAGAMATLRLGALDAGDVFVDGRRVSAVNEPLLSQIDLIEPIAFEALAPDGESVPCFALLPPGETGPRASVVYIHGGPHLMYGRWHLFHEYQALAAQGYVVLFPNPRGSKGYGEAWTGGIVGNWGAPAMSDVMACVDAAIARGWSDQARLAVMGGSYGGYLTAWIAGQTDRFACAIAERGVYNLVSMGGTTDYPWRDYSYFAANHTDDTDAFRANSPLTYAGNVATPLLIVHSEGDLRCPVSQADEYFRAVKRTGKAEVTYLRYGPEANHELSRGGPPDLRLDRQRRFHAWLARFLQAA